jgi:hypothetical protein
VFFAIEAAYTPRLALFAACALFSLSISHLCRIPVMDAARVSLIER